MNWIIGDVHGCYYTLLSLIRKIKRKDKHPTFIFVGDYCDRGKHSKEVINYLIHLQKKENVVCVRGNHDDVIDYLINNHALGQMSEWVVGFPTPEKVVAWFCYHGLDLTLRSYGVDIRTTGPYGQTNYAEAAQEFKETIPEHHKDFFKNLPLFWESDSHFVCHGFFDPGKELPRSLKFIRSEQYEEMMWGRFRIIEQCKWDKIGVFGHTPYTSMLKLDKVRVVDTGVFMGGPLTALCCETDTAISVKADNRDLIDKWRKK